MSDEAITPDEITSASETIEVEEEPPVSEPTKLIRIASMTRAMLEEVRQTPLDIESRRRLLQVHRASLAELREVLSEDLKGEFDEIFRPFSTDDTPTDAELRLAHAQLIGWLEGLFHGIQASIMTQQMMAQTQLAEMTRRQLEAPNPQDNQQKYPGVYL